MARIVLLLVVMALFGAASASAPCKPVEVDPIVGTWSKIDNAVPAFASLPGYVMPPYMSTENYTTFGVVTPTSDPHIFSMLWISFPPQYPITNAMRENGPNRWATKAGAQTLFSGVLAKRATGVYDGLAPVPFTSGTFVLSKDGKKCALIALGSYQKGVNYFKNDGANAFPGIHKQTVSYRL